MSWAVILEKNFPSWMSGGGDGVAGGHAMCQGTEARFVSGTASSRGGRSLRREGGDLRGLRLETHFWLVF